MSGEGGSGLRARVLDPGRMKSDNRTGLEKMVLVQARQKSKGGSNLEARILDRARLEGQGESSVETRVLDPARLKGKGVSSVEARILDPALLTEDVDLTKCFSAAAVAKMATIEQNMYRNKVRNYWTLRELGELGCCCNDWKGLHK